MLYLVYAGLVAVVLLLAAWVPDPEGSGSVWRGYSLTVLGGVAAFFAGRWLMLQLGYPALAHLEFIGALIIGVFLTLCALFRFRFYWQFLELLPPWAAFNDLGRRVTIGAFGIFFLWLATHDGRKLMDAYRLCSGEQQLASGLVPSDGVPDSTLLPMRGRFELPEPPMTCGKILDP